MFCRANFPFLVCLTGGKKEKEMEAKADDEPRGFTGFSLLYYFRFFYSDGTKGFV